MPSRIGQNPLKRSVLSAASPSHLRRCRVSGGRPHGAAYHRSPNAEYKDENAKILQKRGPFKVKAPFSLQASHHLSL